MIVIDSNDDDRKKTKCWLIYAVTPWLDVDGSGVNNVFMFVELWIAAVIIPLMFYVFSFLLVMV